MMPGIRPGFRPPFGFQPSRMKGWVTQFSTEKMSGYLSSNFIQFGTELYFEIHGERTPQIGQAVDFSPGHSATGEPIAVNVTFGAMPARSASPSSQVDTSMVQ